MYVYSGDPEFLHISSNYDTIIGKDLQLKINYLSTFVEKTHCPSAVRF